MNKHARACRHFQLDRLAVLVGLTLPFSVHAQIAEPAPAVMPQVEITAQGLGDTTEGTGSYTTGKAKTATPLSMSLRDTPQSISVVTQQRIEDQGLTSVTDIVNNVTGVSVNQYETNRAGFTARGFDITNLQVDGIPTTWDQAWSAGEVAGSLAMYDHVEVVRGATGLMTGAGNPSAAINLVRKRATSGELTGSAEIAIGTWNERRALVDVSTPVNAAGTVRARAVGQYTQADSWVDALKNKDKLFFGTIEADLTAKTLLSAGFSRQENDPKGLMWGGLPYLYSDGTQTNWSRSKTSAPDWAHRDSTYDNAFVNLEQSFDNGWKISANLTHGKRKADSYLLYISGVPERDTGLGMFAFPGGYQTETKQNDVGVHASGPFSLAGRKHEAAVGYMHSKQDFLSNNRAPDFGTASTDVGNFNHWDPAAYPIPTWGAPTFYDTSMTRQEAVYGVARFSLADPLKLIVGARMSNYEKTGHGLYTQAYTVKHDHEVTPYAGLVYDLNGTYSAYASYTSIFQPQNLKDLAGHDLDPIVGKSTELGIKSDYFGGRLNASASVFQIKQDKLGQEAGLVDRDGTGPLAPETYYRSANGAKSEGFEFEVSGQLTRGWNATAGYTQYHAEDAEGVDINTIYPRRLLRLFSTYQFQDDWKGLTLGGGVNWEGRTFTYDPAAPVQNDGLIEQGAYRLVNLMGRYEFSSKLSAQINVDNLFDKKHLAMFAAYNQINYSAPRSARLTLKYRF